MTEQGTHQGGKKLRRLAPGLIGCRRVLVLRRQSKTFNSSGFCPASQVGQQKQKQKLRLIVSSPVTRT